MDERICELCYTQAMGKIRNVVFDLGGVMLNYNPRSFIDVFGYDDKKSLEVCEAIFMDPVWADMDLGIYKTYTEALPVFIRRHPSVAEEIKRFFQPGWMDVYTLKEDTERELYNWVYDKGLNIYILSNFAADGFTYVYNKYAFFRKSKGYVASAFEGVVKPDRRIYEILLERYGLKAGESVFIDDVQVNIKGAEDAGMQGILFTAPASARAQLEQLI